MPSSRACSASARRVSTSRDAPTVPSPFAYANVAFAPSFPKKGSSSSTPRNATTRAGASTPRDAERADIHALLFLFSRVSEDNEIVGLDRSSARSSRRRTETRARLPAHKTPRSSALCSTEAPRAATTGGRKRKSRRASRNAEVLEVLDVFSTRDDTSRTTLATSVTASVASAARVAGAAAPARAVAAVARAPARNRSERSHPERSSFRGSSSFSNPGTGTRTVAASIAKGKSVVRNAPSARRDSARAREVRFRRAFPWTSSPPQSSATRLTPAVTMASVETAPSPCRSACVVITSRRYVATGWSTVTARRTASPLFVMTIWFRAFLIQRSFPATPNVGSTHARSASATCATRASARGVERGGAEDMRPRVCRPTRPRAARGVKGEFLELAFSPVGTFDLRHSANPSVVGRPGLEDLIGTTVARSPRRARGPGPHFRVSDRRVPPVTRWRAFRALAGPSSARCPPSRPRVFPAMTSAPRRSPPWS